jgi:hypothetical protein
MVMNLMGTMMKTGLPNGDLYLHCFLEATIFESQGSHIADYRSDSCGRTRVFLFTGFLLVLGLLMHDFYVHLQHDSKLCCHERWHKLHRDPAPGLGILDTLLMGCR